MKVIEKKLLIEKEEADLYQEILDIKQGSYPGAGPDSTIQTYTVDFGMGFELDIKICNGESPYIDIVLFKARKEVVYSPKISNSLLAHYKVEHNGFEFIAILEEK